MVRRRWDVLPDGNDSVQIVKVEPDHNIAPVPIGQQAKRFLNGRVDLIRVICPCLRFHQYTRPAPISGEKQGVSEIAIPRFEHAEASVIKQAANLVVNHGLHSTW
jgi:hypothetical protein